MSDISKHQFSKLSIDDENKTVIMAGHTQFKINQLEDEIDANSEIGQKLKSVEKELEKYWLVNISM